MLIFKFQVMRHLQDGDLLLVNRQPTLHKSSIMAHQVREIEVVSKVFMYSNVNVFRARD